MKIQSERGLFSFLFKNTRFFLFSGVLKSIFTHILKKRLSLNYNNNTPNVVSLFFRVAIS